MKRFFFFLSTCALLASICADSSAQFAPGHKKRYSILGDNRDAFFSTVFSTSPAQKNTPKTPPAALPQSPEIAGEEFLQFLEDKKVLKYSEDRWRKTKKATEESIYREGVEVSTQPRPAPAPLPPGLAVDLPYESQLSISGRKTIGISLKQTLYDKEDPQKRKNSMAFDMQQELQVRIKGRVGRKINVNVDFDDTTADKRDISVVYKGDPDEVVQEAAFGDITMSLPQTEFVGYSRQLFGIKVDAKPTRNTQVWGFFSRTKGNTEAKRVTGNTELKRNSIPETSYIEKRYYTLKFSPTDAIRAGSVSILRDDQNPNNNNINVSTLTVEMTNTLTSQTSTYTGIFDLLAAGVDYTVDYERAIVIFRSAVPQNYIIAVDYVRTDGTRLSDGGVVPGSLKVIKDASNTPGVTKELKTFYNMGSVKIIRDNGRGNFILKVVDLNNNTPNSLAPGGSATVPEYPTNITVDFDNGIFNFEPPDQPQFPPDAYTTKQHRYNILTEYRHRLKIITLRPGLVPQSERVTLDGRQLQRDMDYFIDYDAGVVTFFNEEKINENTVIDISYDWAPFGSAGGSTLIGTRVQAALTKNLSVGSSYIYDFAARTQTVPDIRTTPTSLMVWEGDAKLSSISIPYTPLVMSLGGEYARSERNPNIMGKAIIESMEGLQQEDSASINYESWVPGSNPTFPGYNLADVSWVNEEVNRKSINDKIDPKRDEKTQVLSISFDLARSTEVSLIQSLSTVGIDYASDNIKLYLDTWLYGDGNNEEFTIAYGNFKEDADADGVLDTEDRNSDGILNPGEDTGWEFTNKNDKPSKYGVKNAKTDSEDLDKDGRLNPYDIIANPGPYGAYGGGKALGGKSLVDVEGNSYDNISWTGWKHFQIPLEIPAGSLDWQNIKQVRLTIKDPLKRRGNIKIANLTLISYKWKTVDTTVALSTITISAVNNDDTPEYGIAERLIFYNPEYQNLYDVRAEDTITKKEQALSLKYTNNSSTDATLAARVLYKTTYDFSNYKQFRFFINPYKVNADDVFFIQVGNDTSYYEYRIPLDPNYLGLLDPVHTNGWYLITINQIDLTKDGKPDMWSFESSSATTHPSIPGSLTRVVGSPSFQSINQIKTGVVVKPSKSGEIWLNEIHVNSSWIKQGHAWRLNGDFNLQSWATFGGKRKFMDRNFETFSAAITNRDYLEDTAYVNLTRIPFLPVNYSIGSTKTKTPSVLQNQNNLLSLNEEGQVVSYNESVGSSLNPGDLFDYPSRNLFGASTNFKKYFPRFGVQYTRGITDSQQSKLLDDNESYSTSADWPLPVKFSLFPTNLSANYSVSNSFRRIYPNRRIFDSEDYESEPFIDTKIFDQYKDKSITENFHTNQITDNYGLRAPFQFWKGFTFSPSISLSKVREDNRDIMYNFDKSASQSISASTNLKIFQWLQPTYSFSSSINENYNIAFNTNTVPQLLPGNKKSVGRSVSSDVSWNFQVRDFIDYKYTRSLGFSSSFRMQDSDSYENIIGTVPVIGFDNDWAKRLWIRGVPKGSDDIAGTLTNVSMIMFPHFENIDERNENVLKDALVNGTTLQYTTLLKRDDKRFSGRYNPFEAFDFGGRLMPIKTFSMNGTFTHSEDFSYDRGTEKRSFTKIWPDVIFGLSQWENFMFLERWLSNTQLNFSHQVKYSEIRKVSYNQSKSYGSDMRLYLLKKLDMNFGYNTGEAEDYDIVKNVRTGQSRNQSVSGQTGFYLGKWRLTSRYEYGDSHAKDGTGKDTADLMTKTYTETIYSDMSFPGGVPIPFTKKTLPLTNRLIFNNTLTWTNKNSNVKSEDNTDSYGVNSTVDYEISSNFRAALGIGVSRMVYRENKDADSDPSYTAIEASGRLTIQF